MKPGFRNQRQLDLPAGIIKIPGEWDANRTSHNPGMVSNRSPSLLKKASHPPRSPGPYMTILLPPYRPGEPRAQRRSTYLNEDRTKTGRKRMNLAAVQAIIHHGKAAVIPAELMSEASTIVGIMRF